MMRVILAVIAAFVLSSATAGAQPSNEPFARRQFESGMTFLGNDRYTEAMKDLQAVVDSFPGSSVADDALLQIAQFQLEHAHDLDAAQTAIDKLLKDYPDADSAPMGHVLAGRIAFAKGRTSAAVDAALASYERVPRLFPGNEAVAAAGYFAGETLRTMRRDADALERYRRVTLEFPRSIWAARADLSAGYCLIQQGKAAQALQQFQHARQLQPDTATARTALYLNSIAYRLYMHGAQPAFTYTNKPIGPERSEFRDVVGIKFSPTGDLMLGHKSGIAFFKPDGEPSQTMQSSDLSAFVMDDQGQIVIARQGTLVTGRAEAIAFAGLNSDGEMHAVDDIPSVLLNDQGERIIANPKGRTVIRAMPNGRFVSVFATGNIARMAQNWMGDVAMIDRSTKTVIVADRDGKVVTKIAAKGTGYELSDPTDLAYDLLGHLYVLDRGRSAVFVFGPKGALVTSLVLTDKMPGALNHGEALGVDGAGRLYVFDDRSRRIQVYQ
ncbi:MAG: tetratricopeptide repeat protein [Vicinamibacterales bacterium]